MLIDKEDRLTLQEILQEHFERPNFKTLINDKDADIIELKSETCSDRITLQIKSDQEKILWVCFSGQACAISCASTDIWCYQLQNVTFKEALKRLKNYQAMITGQPYDETLLDELIIFHKIYEQQSRINCALFSANGLKDYIIQKGENNNAKTTETRTKN